MEQLPESHERDYLELLKPYVSEEQKKFRRNTLVSSFVILSVYILGKSLTDIRVAGINLEGGSKFSILVLAGVMVIFWLVMYLIYYWRDLEVQKEQNHLLLKHVINVKERLDSFKRRVDGAMASNGAVNNQLRSEYTNAQSTYGIYESQLLRTNKAGLLNSVLSKVELLLPVLAAVVCLIC